MLYLAGSILLTSYLSLSFKVTHKHHIPNLQVLFFISVISTLTGILIQGSLPFMPTIIRKEWFTWSMLIGIVFIALFLLIAFVTQHMGIAIAAAANRLSLVIPFTFSVLYFREPASVGKLAAIVIIVAAVWMICRPPADHSSSSQKKAGFSLLLPGLIFLISGLRDIMVKYVQQQHLNQEIQGSFLIASFAAAAITGALYLVIRLLMKKEAFHPKSMIAGVIIGVPTYFSFWCMVNFLQQYERQSAIVIPINNLAIVLVTATAGMLFYKEKLSTVNWIGVILSVAGMLLLSFS